MTPLNFDELLTYCRTGRRVCPMPIAWNRLWKLLPVRQCGGGASSPPPPLILAAWEATTDAQKQERLTCHIRWADEQGVLKQVADLILSLEETEWLLKESG